MGHNWNNSATDSGKKEEGSNPPVEFTGPQVVENDCKIWTIICVRTIVPKNSFIKPFLCGFCVIKELTKSLLWCGWPVFCNKGWQHYQMRAQEKCAYLWCWWEAGADVFVKMVSVAVKTSVVITSIAVCKCHHLPSGFIGLKPIIAKFISRDTKQQLVKKKYKLKTINFR